MRRTYTLLYMTPLLVAMNFASCQNRQTGSIQTKEAKDSSFVTDSAQSEKSIKSETETEEHKHFQELMNSVIKDDAAAFAHMTSYPIMRTYPMKWIEDSTDMVKFFSIMADDSLKSILKKTTPDMWEQVGWRGYTFRNGEYFWDEGYALSGINYVSKKEDTLRKQLIHRDLATLHPSLKTKQLVPFACFFDKNNHAIYRVDLLGAEDMYDENAKYRMAVYLRNSDLRGKPDYVLDTDFSLEGSAGVRVYEASDQKGNKISFYVDFYEQTNNFEAEVKLAVKKENITSTEPIGSTISILIRQKKESEATMIVIHPKDRTTKMLELLYKDSPHTLVDTTLSKNQLRALLYNEPSVERFMLLGHGGPEGLFTRTDDTQNSFTKLIDHSFAHILRKHQGKIFAVFCHAKLFAEKEFLHGLFSGMIISEMSEAIYYGITTTEEELAQENVKLAKRLRTLLDENTPWCLIPERILQMDDVHSPLTEFNYHNFFYI